MKGLAGGTYVTLARSNCGGRRAALGAALRPGSP